MGLRLQGLNTRDRAMQILYQHNYLDCFEAVEMN